MKIQRLLVAQEKSLMTDEVYECFQRIISSRKKPRVEPIVGGKCGFLYLDKNDMPYGSLALGKILSAYL